MTHLSDFVSVSEQVVNCRRCPRLVQWRQETARTKRAAYRDWDYWGRGVPGFGDTDADIVFVGLAPGAHGANRTGRVFTGDASGDFLFSSLYRHRLCNSATSESVDDGLVLYNTYIACVVRCVPPQNSPTPSERDSCVPYLEAELGLLSPRVVVALGAFAFNACRKIFGLGAHVKFEHGAEATVERPKGAPEFSVLLGSYHVSQQNTRTGKLTADAFDEVVTRAVEIAGSP